MWGSGFIRSSLGFLALLLSAAISLAWVTSAFASSPPSIDSESATSVTQNDATLNARINPNGSYTAYEFQIDTTGNYDYPHMVCPLPVPGYVQCMAMTGQAPLPPGLVEPSPQSIPAGSGDQSVSLDLASIGATLQPGTTYHYRAIASNGGPVVYGSDQTFTTIHAVCLLLSATTPASSYCPPRLMVGFRGQVMPKELPKHEMAPVTLNIRGGVKTSNGTQPAALREVTIDFDQNGAINATGLPVCKRSQLEVGRIRAARRLCRKSIVGTGVAHVAIKPSQQGPIPIPLTLFNGGVKGETTRLFIRPAITVATRAPTVVTVKLRKIHKGPHAAGPRHAFVTYGLQAVATIPPIAGNEGSLLDFSIKIRRLFTYKGAKQSYALARCLDGHLSANIRNTFIGGTIISGTVTQPCTPKG